MIQSLDAQIERSLIIELDRIYKFSICLDGEDLKGRFFNDIVFVKAPGMNEAFAGVLITFSLVAAEKFAATDLSALPYLLCCPLIDLLVLSSFTKPDEVLIRTVSFLPSSSALGCSGM